MNDEPGNLNLNRLTEYVAGATGFTLGAAIGDPKAAIVRCLQRYLADVREQEGNNALYSQQLEEREQFC